MSEYLTTIICVSARDVYSNKNTVTDSKTYPSGYTMANSRGPSQLDHWTAWTVFFFVKFRLVRFEHSNFAPSVEEQCNGRHPQYHHTYDNERLLGPYNNWTQNTIVFLLSSFVIYSHQVIVHQTKQEFWKNCVVPFVCLFRLHSLDVMLKF